jgi:hypothetical protein
MVNKEQLEAIMTDNKVVNIKEQAPVLSPRQYLEEAISKGAGVEVIEKLLGMQERWEAMQAKKAFNNAIAKFKAAPPAILKNVQVGYESRRTGESTSYKHEDLAELLAAVDPALAQYGLWVRFKVSSGDKVTVTCIVGHADGYSEEASTLSSAPDTSGNKNPIQAIGSAVSYLQRYTLKAALGLAAAKDDDGRASGRVGGVLSPEQADQINKHLLEHPYIDVDKFLKLAGAESVSDIMAVKFDSAMQWLRRQTEKKGKK